MQKEVSEAKSSLQDEIQAALKILDGGPGELHEIELRVKRLQERVRLLLYQLINPLSADALARAEALVRDAWKVANPPPNPPQTPRDKNDTLYVTRLRELLPTELNEQQKRIDTGRDLLLRNDFFGGFDALDAIQKGSRRLKRVIYNLRRYDAGENLNVGPDPNAMAPAAAGAGGAAASAAAAAGAGGAPASAAPTAASAAAAGADSPMRYDDLLAQILPELDGRDAPAETVPAAARVQRLDEARMLVAEAVSRGSPLLPYPPAAAAPAAAGAGGAAGLASPPSRKRVRRKGKGSHGGRKVPQGCPPIENGSRCPDAYTNAEECFSEEYILKVLGREEISQHRLEVIRRSLIGMLTRSVQVAYQALVQQRQGIKPSRRATKKLPLSLIVRHLQPSVDVHTGNP